MATMIISSPPPAEDAMSASKVLGDEDLLGEILRRVDSPTSLVRAALVSKRWLRTASGRDLVRCFCALHPPCRHLLGFYVTGDCVPRPEFVSMPALEPHDRELSAVLRQASNSVFEAFPEYSSRVWDSRDGRVLFDFTETVHGTRRFGVRHPDRGVSELPPMPSDWPDPEPQCPEAMLLPDDGNDDATCYRLRYRYSGPKVTALVGVLRSGVWTVHCAAEAVLAMAPDRIPLLTRLASGKLYMVAVAGYILGLDMATSSFFVIDFPEGVAYEYYGNLVPCRGDGSVLYLIHLMGDRLCVWLRRIVDEHGAGEWVLRDTISLNETCGHLVESGMLEPAAGHTAVATVAGVGDNAEFVFLELFGDGGVFVHMHLSSRKVERVYQRDPYNDEITEVYPCSMVWLPLFPAIDEGEGGQLHQEEAST
ncbi:hypothetical protein HU200_060434 [Digitaria exilis]|uniref:F-box protein AT5G49610-like beta-propeller domain-containing protein n=1 Tax=Digitaria exilis TaxID=1010633 RepID=A0A835AEN8_9POAL|nr:hypothetical protein HU200_060434 [Digitaria exilis]